MLRRSVLLTTCLAVASAQAALAGGPVTEHAADNPDRIICKTFPVTGSLVQVRRECAPKRDWEIRRADLRASDVANSCRLLGDGGHC